MPNPSVVPANTVFQYIALVYSGRILEAKRAARELGVKKALSIDGHVGLVKIVSVTARNRRWDISRIKDALNAYQREKFTHSYENGVATGAILCKKEWEGLLEQCIREGIFPKDIEIRYL